MKSNILSFSVALLCALLLLSCTKPKPNANWLAEDDVNVAIDETFKPIMNDIAETFAMANPESEVHAIYASEDSVIRLLVNDSLRCCIATRKLTERERTIVKGRTLGVNQAMIASDAIALIVNKQNLDSLITLPEIKDIVSGKITRWEQLKHHSRKGELKLVFDHSGSSTVRFMKDSLCNGADLKGNVYASEGKTNLSVIDMVKNDPTIIGVVGTNWLKGNSAAPLSDFSKLDVNVMRVALADDGVSKYVRPYQYYIATGDYPLLRSVYIIHTDPRSKSFVKNFYYFVKGQKGQTIICNSSQLLPITPVQVKKVSVN